MENWKGLPTYARGAMIVDVVVGDAGDLGVRMEL